MTVTTNAELLNMWRAAESEALAPLGWQPVEPDVYRAQLDAGDDWLGFLYLPKNPHGGSIAYAALANPGPGLVHQPTERLVAELEAATGRVPAPKTAGALLARLVPAEKLMGYSHIDVRGSEQIEPAVDRTVELLTGYLLPWLRELVEPGALRAYLSGPPFLPHLREAHQRRRVAFEYLSGDRDAARAALEDYEAHHVPSKTPEVEQRHTNFVAGARGLLSG